MIPTLDTIADLFQARGSLLTAQRRAVLRYLQGNTQHPSAAQIFEAVTRDFPVASRATIYNTLSFLEELGVLHTVQGADGHLRYDPNIAPHHHLLCPKCGRMEDIPATEVTLLLRGEQVLGTVRFEVVCSNCVVKSA